jgi:hypothetical protein
VLAAGVRSSNFTLLKLLGMDQTTIDIVGIGIDEPVATSTNSFLMVNLAITVTFGPSNRQRV